MDLRTELIAAGALRDADTLTPVRTHDEPVLRIDAAAIAAAAREIRGEREPNSRRTHKKSPNPARRHRR